MSKKETVKESVKPIILKDTQTDKEYTLEFNKEAVLFAEARGFNIDEVLVYPMTRIPELFYYSFRAHHKNLSRGQTDEILASMGGIENVPDNFIARLRELYDDPVANLFGEATENPRFTVEL